MIMVFRRLEFNMDFPQVPSPQRLGSLRILRSLFLTSIRSTVSLAQGRNNALEIWKQVSIIRKS